VVEPEWHVVLPGVGLTPARRIWNAISEPFASKEVSQKSVTHTILRIDRQVWSNFERLWFQFGNGSNVRRLKFCAKNRNYPLVGIMFGRSFQQDRITRSNSRKREREGKCCDVWKTTAILEA
jgi:hypothetical protein